MTIDQFLGYIFSVLAQFGIDNAIKVVFVIILAGIFVAMFLRSRG